MSQGSYPCDERTPMRLQADPLISSALLRELLRRAAEELDTEDTEEETEHEEPLLHRQAFFGAYESVRACVALAGLSQDPSLLPLVVEALGHLEDHEKVIPGNAD